MAHCTFVIASSSQPGKLIDTVVSPWVHGSPQLEKTKKRLEHWLEDTSGVMDTVDFMFQKAEKNQNGQISKAEAVTIIRTLTRNSGLKKPSQTTLATLWKKFSANDNNVTGAQLASLLIRFAQLEKV